MTTSYPTINSKNLAQLSIDGQNVNWLLLDLLEKQREQQELPKLLNIGSCNLHVIHVAFKTGFKSTEWNIEKLMKASYSVFPDSPTRRPDYVTVTECENFSHAFSSTNSSKHQKVANILCSIWGDIKKITKYWEALPKKRNQSARVTTES